MKVVVYDSKDTLSQHFQTRQYQSTELNVSGKGQENILVRLLTTLCTIYKAPL